MESEIELCGVYVAFEDANGIQTVLEDINIQFLKGEWVSIIGKNGSGKSTLASILAGLIPISKGTVVRPKFDHAIQLIFQNPEAQIVGETIYEDICFGMENVAIPSSEMKQRAVTVLQQVGLQIPLDSSTSRLSGGQKQLLSIAGCLAMDAQVIVFDESTSMLDPSSRDQILLTARQLHKQGKTIIWITQWMEEIIHSDRVIALETGRIVYEGSPREFFYGTDYQRSDAVSACDQLSFLPPYSIQVAKQLIKRGIVLKPLPLQPEELGRLVSVDCRSK